MTKEQFTKRAFSWMNPSLEVRDTGKYGKGVFANEDIEKDGTLAIFGGYILTVKEEEKLPKNCKDSGVQISEEFVLTNKDAEEDADFFNHSCEPNAGYKGQIFLAAIRDIKKGEEVTFDYAMVLHKARDTEEYRMKCCCGSEKCRGYITENDWKIPELQEKYNGYFQWYLQEKIKG